LSLTKKQIKYIQNKRRKYSAAKLAKNLGVEENEIQKYLNDNPLPKTPKIFYAFLILIPILFFGLLEISLQIFNYGYDTRTWIEVRPGRLGLNPEFARRYFYNTKSVPQSIQDTFLKDKPKNTFRVFVLGGSSAAGYPFMPLGSFSRYVRRRLEIMYPKSNIEVVNVALTAVNSYTIRDLVPDVLNEKPDLILIYAGHNEYYGALGVGSLESLGRNRHLVNFILSLNGFRTVQLLRNTIKSIIKIFSNGKPNNGTLMSRMAKKKAIPYDSEIYNEGLEQFEGNMHDVLKMIKDRKVPVIISTLTSNLKGIPPFIYKKTDKFPSAKTVFEEAQKQLGKNDVIADSLFRFAKDLDMLRFRAPEKVNSIIDSLSLEFDVPLINSDSLFASLSKDNIVGNNLITDHLHPTLRGYQYIGKLFYDEMNKLGYLPDSKAADIPFDAQDSVTIANYVFSSFDSTVAAFKLKLLKNDWPFITKENATPINILLKRNSYIDSIAYDFAASKLPWEKAERLIAVHYLRQKNYKMFIKQMELLIEQYPMVPDYYNMIAKELLQLRKFDAVYDFLKRRYSVAPDYFSTKWLGIIELSRKHYKQAIKYLEESVKIMPNDSQVLYNLSGAYAKNGEYQKALNSIKSCLSISPNYAGAKNLERQLLNIVKKN